MRSKLSKKLVEEPNPILLASKLRIQVRRRRSQHQKGCLPKNKLKLPTRPSTKVRSLQNFRSPPLHHAEVIFDPKLGRNCVKMLRCSILVSSPLRTKIVTFDAILITHGLCFGNGFLSCFHNQFQHFCHRRISCHSFWRGKPDTPNLPISYHPTTQ